MARASRKPIVSGPTILVTLPGGMNTPPFVVPQQQLNGIPDTTALAGQTFDYFVPLTTIFGDGQTLPSNLIYTATLADGQACPRQACRSHSRRSRHLVGTGEFNTLPPDLLGPDGVANTGTRPAAPSIPPARSRSALPPRIPVPGVPLSVTDTFFINVLPIDTPPVANNDSYSILEDATLTVTPATQGVLPTTRMPMSVTG